MLCQGQCRACLSFRFAANVSMTCVWQSCFHSRKKWVASEKWTYARAHARTWRVLVLLWIAPYMVHLACDGADGGYSIAGARLSLVRQALWRREAQLGLAELQHHHQCQAEPTLA